MTLPKLPKGSPEWIEQQRRIKAGRTPDPPAPPAGVIFDSNFTMNFRLGVFDCPHCGGSIHLHAHRAGPTKETAIADCPLCTKPIRIELTVA